MAFRSLGHILAALLVLLSLATGAGAAVQVRVMPAASSGAAGSTVTVTVEADSVTGLGGFQFGFTYSAADLQAVSATVNPAFDQIVTQDLGTAAGSGMIAATVFDNPPLSGTPVTLATLVFRIVTPATRSITLANVVLGQVGGAEIPSTPVGGTVAGYVAYTLTFTSAGNGTITGATSQAVPAGGSAATVTAVPATGYHFVNWTEGATVVATTAAWTAGTITSAHGYTANFAADPVNGVCGSSHGSLFASIPTTNLCAVGTPGAVTGSGPWNWGCSGSNGGSPAACSAGIDITGPALTISTLANGAITNNAILNVAGTATDVSGVAGLTINNTPVALTSGAFSHPVVLQAGANTVTTVARDTLGNSTGDSRTITLDAGAPVLTIAAPADNSALAASVVTVTGTLGKAATVQATVNGGGPQSASSDGSSFSVSLNLAAGINTISVTATDQAGNSATEKRTITSDTGKPTLAVTEPPQDMTSTQPTLMLSGMVSDNSSPVTVTITMDGLVFTPQVLNGAFQEQLTFSTAKEYAINVTTTDQGGNSASVQRNIISNPIVPLTVTAANITKATGSDIPPLTAIFSGFVNGDTAAVLGGAPSLMTPAAAGSAAGTYPIHVTQGTLSAPANYSFVFVDGTLSVVDMSVDTGGRTTTAISTATSPGVKVQVASGTMLSDANGNPVSGTLSMTSTTTGSLAGLPSSAASGHSTDGSSLASLGASIDLNLSAGGAAVKTISPAMTVTLPVPRTFAVPGTAVGYYSFDGTRWQSEGTATVKADGSVDMRVGHLSIWAVARFKQLPTGKIASDGTSTVTIADALRALQIAVGMIAPTAADLANGDVAPLVDGRPLPNGSINVGDAIVILQKSLGIVTW